MKIYNAAIIGLGPSGLAVNKLIYNNQNYEVIAFENTNIDKRNNFFGFWLTDWMIPFENLIEKKWNNWVIANDKIKIYHSDSDHPYCVISFKTWKNFCLSTKNKLLIKNKKVIQYHKVENYFKIITDDNKEYFAKKIYDSRSIKEKNNELIQHFYGINIFTENKQFDKNKVTLMHFTNEEKFLHFIYVLPFSENNALIESTVFSKKILNEEWYREKIKEHLKILKITDYKENSSEKGVIPMFFAAEKPVKDPNIFNIGIRGGSCKPSTGYAFSFLIKQIQLLKNKDKKYLNIHNFIDRKMDNVFVNYLKNNIENGNSFLNLAKNLNGNEFQNFMMGQSNILTKFKIINSMPKIAFLKSIFK